MTAEFVDTNVLIYAHDRTAGLKHDRAVALLARLTNDDSGALSLQVLMEFYSAATRKLPMPAAKAEEAVRDFGVWTIHCPAHADLIRAARLQRSHNVSWWDALILNSCIELGCGVLWSEDFSNGRRYSGVTVRNPFL